MGTIDKQNFKNFYTYLKPYLERNMKRKGVAIIPVGTILPLFRAVSWPEINYCLIDCDGYELPIDTYTHLKQFFKDQFGSVNYFGGDGVNTFAVPNLNGEFLRGAGTNSKRTHGSGADVGVHQDASEINGGWANNSTAGYYYTETPGSAYHQLNGYNFDLRSTIGTRNSYLFLLASYYGVSDTLWTQTTAPTRTSVRWCIAAMNIYIDLSENEYDSFERECGTWIDGKTLYQCTFTYKGTVVANSIILLGTIPEMEMGFVSEGFFVFNSSSLDGEVFPITFSGRNSSSTTVDCFAKVDSTGQVSVYFGSATDANEISVTVLYTKKVRPKLRYLGTATSLSVARKQLAAASNASYLFFAGGYSTSAVATVDAYDEALVRSTASLLSVVRYDLAGTSTGDYVLFSGGLSSTSSSNGIVNAYDLTMTRTILTDKLNRATNGTSAARAGNYGLFAGGGTSGGNYTDVCAFDSSLVKTVPTNLLSTGLYYPAGVSFGDYALFAGSGSTSVSNKSNVVNVYNASLTRSIPTALSVARNMACGASNSSYALVGGGNKADAYSNVVDAYDTSLTRTVPEVLNVGVWSGSATSVDKYIIFGGGKSSGSSYTDIVTVYNETLTKINISNLSAARGYLAAATIGNYALFGGGTASAVSCVVDVYCVK